MPNIDNTAPEKRDVYARVTDQIVISIEQGEVTEIKTIPYVPLSHPFVERLIGTVRREYLDQFFGGLPAASHDLEGPR